MNSGVGIRDIVTTASVLFITVGLAMRDSSRLGQNFREQI
jgi:hypothetical protein